MLAFATELCHSDPFFPKLLLLAFFHFVQGQEGSTAVIQFHLKKRSEIIGMGLSCLAEYYPEDVMHLKIMLPPGYP